ncbi:uncharacterized protein LOC129316890 [Prosopis cineraria]|uniref:uncharacterized protein LOC129316890 n=1 Tax=Prosopis cineraria TaxID=364024 RepID=UPI00240F1D65|nr:uncharacterized protein LOC129316890 [Prosopis cineraria]XP_054817248.1 uncharacterized protein LOC129316890 [Prosopis cineraria]XP_054817249.1 uncharacterized protein LOC129316890 [Prosopis cineraria]XP_054817250.1 uncharacterized protein LOC129316890 [Prosopis cineraria]
MEPKESIIRSNYRKLCKDGVRSTGTPGGSVGTHDHPREYNSVSYQPPNGDAKRQASTTEGSTETHKHNNNNIKPTISCETSQTTDETQTEALSHPLTSSDGDPPRGTDGGDSATNGFQKTE